MAELLQNDGFAALRPVVRALVAHVLGARSGDADVEDCTSEAFRRAIEGRHRLEDGAPVRPWLLGIARHVALDARRARVRALQRAAPGRVADDDDMPPLLDQLPSSAPDPLERAQSAERSARLQAALARLPHDQRRALTLHADGLAYREIAVELSVPIGTVCTWIARARSGLSRALNEDVGEQRR
jgi:RNA polymerase sigma-70 factor (ECF subfamily)